MLTFFKITHNFLSDINQNLLFILYMQCGILELIKNTQK